jgi:hypothetical protein
MKIVFHLIPAADRDAIVGDLLEEAECRGIAGARRALWLAGECGGIALGLNVQRVRRWFVLPPIHEIATGLTIDGWWAPHGDRWGAVMRGLVFCGSVATLALGVELLVRTLLTASGY